MKKLLLIASVIAAFAFSSCGSGMDQENSSINTVTDVVTTGKWKVAIYLDANQDQTNDFDGYSFTFSRNGSLTAATGGTVTPGTWVEDQANRKLTISFPSADPVLSRINDVWTVTDVNFQMISLTNSSPQSEYLGIGQQ
jgi:hypothetical protein